MSRNLGSESAAGFPGSDLVAGVTVALVGVPQCLAYALISGLPPAWGLSTAVVAGLVAALLGRSAQVVTGPTNTTSLLVLGALTPWLAGNGLLPPEHLGVVATLALLAGLIRIAAALLGGATLIRFLPESVLAGFIAGAGVMIAGMQLDEALGLPPQAARSLLAQLSGLLRAPAGVSLAAVAATVATLAAIVLLERVAPRVPGALLLLLGMAGVARLLGLDGTRGLPLVGERVALTGGWPRGALPDLSLATIEALMVPAAAIVLLGTLELTAATRAQGGKADLRTEILAQGWANAAGAFAACIPASASLTRSALLRMSGARTRVAAAAGALVLLPVALFATPLAGAIPEASLAAVLLLTAWRMVDREAMRRLWRASAETRLLLVLTFASTLVMRFEWAILFGAGVGLVIHLANTGAPRLRLLCPEAGRLVPCAEARPEVVVLEVSGDLHYAAVPPFAAEAERLIPDSASSIVLDLSHAHQVRFTALAELERMAETAARGGARLLLAGIDEETRELIERTGSPLRHVTAELEPGLSVKRGLERLEREAREERALQGPV